MAETAKGISEDVLALFLALLIFLPALPTIFGIDLLGWAVTTSVWINLDKALAPVSKSS